MSKVLVSEGYLSDIADSIRAKNGSQDTYTPGEMSTAIDEIETGGGDLTEYFTETITPQSGYSGVAKMIKKLPSDISLGNTEMRYAFYGCFNLESLPLFNTSNVSRFDWAFRFCEKVKEVPLYDMSSCDNLEYTFYGCSSLETIPLFNTSNVTSMYGTFMACSKLKTIPLLDFSKVDNMYNCFAGCTSLESIPSIDTQRATNMAYAFNGCSKLKDVPVLKTSSLRSSGLNSTFAGCTQLSSESLNNILKMCIDATGLSMEKTLSKVGLTNAQAITCQGLSNYQDFLDAGWTTGY